MLVRKKPLSVANQQQAMAKAIEQVQKSFTPFEFKIHSRMTLDERIKLASLRGHEKVDFRQEMIKKYG